MHEDSERKKPFEDRATGIEGLLDAFLTFWLAGNEREWQKSASALKQLIRTEHVGKVIYDRIEADYAALKSLPVPSEREQDEMNALEFLGKMLSVNSKI